MPKWIIERINDLGENSWKWAIDNKWATLNNGKMNIGILESIYISEAYKMAERVYAKIIQLKKEQKI